MMTPSNRASQLWTKTVSSSIFRLLLSGICHTCLTEVNMNTYAKRLWINIKGLSICSTERPPKMVNTQSLSKLGSSHLRQKVIHYFNAWGCVGCKFFMNNHLNRCRAHILTLDSLHFQNGISCRSPGMILCVIFPIYKNWAYTLKKERDKILLCSLHWPEIHYSLYSSDWPWIPDIPISHDCSLPF